MRLGTMDEDRLENFRKLTPPLRRAVRFTTAVVLPFFLLWAFVSVLVAGLGKAFVYAWLEVRIEAESFTRFWRMTSPDKNR